jgi:hypothetical protein
MVDYSRQLYDSMSSLAAGLTTQAQIQPASVPVILQAGQGASVPRDPPDAGTQLQHLSAAATPARNPQFEQQKVQAISLPPQHSNPERASLIPEALSLLNTKTDGVPAPAELKRVHFPDDLVAETRVVARLKRSLHDTLEAKEED